MADFKFKEKYNVYDLTEIVKALRSENGCPWDKEQTHASIRNNFLEEVYEVMEAIDLDNVEMMREELGDVLLQVVFHSVMETEKGSFDLDDVADEVCKKLIERHPHVFGTVKVNGTDDVLTNWENIKQKSKGQESYTDTLNSVPQVFPPIPLVLAALPSGQGHPLQVQSDCQGSLFRFVLPALSCRYRSQQYLPQMPQGASARTYKPQATG